MENNFLSLIKTRRSVRAYKAEPVPPEALDAVLEAGTYAPTGGGRQSPTPAADVNPPPLLQSQTPNIDRKSQS